MTSSNDGVVIPFVGDPFAFGALAGQGDFAVLYLGSSFADFTALPRQLPGSWTLLPAGQMLNAAALRLRDAVIDLDAAVLKPGAPRGWWDATHMGERNPLASGLQLNLARLAVLRDVLATHRRVLVLCDDLALCHLLYDEIDRSGHRAGWLGSGRVLPFTERLKDGIWALRSLARGLRVRARGLTEFARRRSLLRRLRRQHPLPLELLRQAQLLLVSWSRAETFPPGAALPNDPYLPLLAETVASRLPVAYLMRALPGVTNFPALARGALACATPVLLLEELVSWQRVLVTAVRSLFLPWRMPRATVAGFDVTALLRYEAWRELGSWDDIFAVAHRAACRRLAALGLRPRILVHPFEHQPWEKLLLSGVRNDLSGCRVIGIQHSPFAHTYLSLFPSHAEVEQGLIPDRLLLCGEGYVRWFRGAGIPADRMAVVGAPRYEQARAAARLGGRSILCCTGIDLPESIELAAKAALACRDMDRPLTVNYHPVTDAAFRRTLRETVAHIVGAHVANLDYVDAPASKLLKDAALVLYSTSAAAFDALLAGKPAIYVGRDVNLDLDKVPGELARHVTSVDDLRVEIQAALASPPAGHGVGHWLAPFDPQKFTDQLLVPTPTGRAA